ncbi:hypothetical protein RsoM2USA_141 [Ralstonia phage RsoM2USA]|nr:hypothetical protein RsoM2USA_141 [Ralstonia phage RsoM2USA]
MGVFIFPVNFSSMPFDPRHSSRVGILPRSSMTCCSATSLTDTCFPLEIVMYGALLNVPFGICIISPNTCSHR